ncbi:MAG: glycosyltransferase family 2 protein [Thermodesulfovibrionales bacterium]
MNDNPLVSIITPTLNSERFISDNIKSILAQSYPNIEHIIVDGGSSDDTLSIIWELDPGAVVISEPDKGISDAFNKGLKLATGDIIAILNSDDYYAHSDVVQRIVDLFNAPPRKEIVYGRVRCIDQKTGQTLVIYGEPFSFKKMSKEIIVPHPAIFAARKVYEAMGPFSLDYKVAMDYEYFLRATSSFEPYFMDEVLSVMRWGGLSARNIYLAHFEHYRIHRANGWNLMKAVTYQLYGIIMTTLSLALQRAGLIGVIFFYRKTKGRMD